LGGNYSPTPQAPTSTRSSAVKRLVVADGVLDFWQSKSTSIAGVERAKYAKVITYEGQDVAEMWHPGGRDNNFYFPGILDGGTFYAGTTMHGKISSRLSNVSGLDIVTDDGSTFAFPNLQHITLPYTYLVKLSKEGLALPAPGAVPGRSVKPYAVLFGEMRSYDLPSGLRLNNTQPYEAEDGERFSITVNAYTGTTDLSSVTSGAITLNVRAERTRPRANYPEGDGILNVSLPFSRWTDSINRYCTWHVTSSPDGKKACVILFGIPTNPMPGPSLDVRMSQEAFAIWEVTFSGGSRTELPTATVRAVASAADYSDTKSWAPGLCIGYYANTWLPSSYWDTNYNAYVSLMWTGGGGVRQPDGSYRYKAGYVSPVTPKQILLDVGQRTRRYPVFAGYDAASNLQVMTCELIDAVEGDSTQTTNFDQDHTCEWVVSAAGATTWIKRLPDLSWTVNYERRASRTIRILRNNEKVAEHVDRWGEVATTWWTATSLGYGWVLHENEGVVWANEPTTKPTLMASNNVVLLAHRDVVTLKGHLVSLPTEPARDKKNRFWVSWHPVTDQYTTVPGETWC